MEEKRQQLTFEKGITNVPSDSICSDNSLAESVGMVYSDGEHRVIQQPKMLFSSTNTIIYTHVTSSGKNYIALSPENNLRYIPSGATGSSVSLDKVGVVLSISSVGNTLIVAYAEGLHYWLWKGDVYVNLGGKIPEPSVRFRLVHDTTGSQEAGFETVNASYTGIITQDEEGGELCINNEYRKDVESLIIGLYAEVRKKIHRKKMFCQPFFARYALELFDGTYHYLSNPVLCYPSVNENSYMYANTDGNLLNLYTHAARLQYSQTTDYSEWADIVKDVVIFVSREINIYEDKIEFEKYPAEDGSFVGNKGDVHFFPGKSDFMVDGISYGHGPTSCTYWKEIAKETWKWNPLTKRSDENKLEDLRSTSTFFKLCNVGTRVTSGWRGVQEQIGEFTLENIETQEQVEHDDYYSRAAMRGKCLYSYNSRLHLANVERGFFEGYSQFAAEEGRETALVTTITVYIRTAEGVRWVQKQISTQEYIGWYFFYPDPRAFAASFQGATVPLTEHPGLNGAYYMGAYFAQGVNRFPETTTAPTGAQQASTEALRNRIFVSPTNNPFVFFSDGDITVGRGEVTGMATLTAALSQGQFGQYPLVALCTDGVWALGIDGTGVYQSVKPMSREVCNNPRSIVETDGAVFFTSKKGLMMVAGSEVRPMSEQVMGKKDLWAEEQCPVGGGQIPTFAEFFEGCSIAYDYRDSLLWITNGSYDFCVIYSIKGRTFARYDSLSGIPIICKDYPDYLLQTENNVYSLTGRDDINDDTGTYNAAMLTRPMKLENGLALKSIMQVSHVSDINEDGSMTLKIFSSNDLRNWTERGSLRGVPMKYYRFLYTFQGLKATDRFAGSVIVTQERRTDKLR